MFIEWCGLIGDGGINDKLKPNTRIYKPDLYTDFIEDNPDFAPKSRFTVSRIKFYQWIKAFCLFYYKADAQEGKDLGGRFFYFEKND